MNRLAPLLLLLASCGASPVNPVNWFGGGGGDSTQPPESPPPDPITGTAEAWLDMFLRFGWFVLILLFVLPGVRTPVLTLFTAIFRLLTIPFEAGRIKFDDWRKKKDV